MTTTAIRPAPVDQIESFLMEVTDAVNTTLDLDALMRRIATLVRRVIDYEIFAIALLNEKTQQLRMRFEIGHRPGVMEGLRINVGQGITGQAVQRREAVMVGDVTRERNYINAHPEVRSELAVPLIVKNRVIGVIDIQSKEINYFTDEHTRLLTLIASRIAQGIENARLYTRIARQAQTLSTLNEISRELTSILKLDELLQRIGELLSRVIDYQMFGVLLLDPTGTKLQHRFSLRFGENVQVKEETCAREGLVGYAVSHREPVLVADVTKDPRYRVLNPETRSELVVPLIYKDRVIGVLDLEHTRKGYFTEDHMRTLTTLAAQVAIAIENARLYEQIQRQELRLERDLELARQLQVRLLPGCCPDVDGVKISARFAPAAAIGGDLYDFMKYSDGRTAIAIGDVSGKGAPAAIYAALVSGILRIEATSEPGAARMLAALNTALCERPIDAQFVSMIYSLWDHETRTLRIANSGLPRPVHCRDGELKRIEAVGLPLGLFPHAEYEEMVLNTESGDVVVFFSDGMLDARNQEGELFGRDRLEGVVRANCGRRAGEIVDAICSAVAAHAAGTEPFDDQTAIVFKID